MPNLNMIAPFFTFLGFPEVLEKYGSLRAQKAKFLKN